MTNPLQPQACEILSVKKESRHEWTFRVATDAKPAHGQFMQLSIPMIGEAPISVSAQGDGWLEFTIRLLLKDHVGDLTHGVRPGRRVAGVHHPLRG